MITIPFVYTAAVYTVIYLLVRAFVCIRTKCIGRKRELAHSLMYFNLLVIIYLTFSPLILDFDRIFDFRINPVPFVYLTDYDNSTSMIMNVFGNILMFVPTGILLPVLYKRLNSFAKVAGTGFLISLAIEILQLPFASRTSDVDDLIMNTLGAATGYVIYMIACYAFGRKKRSATEVCDIYDIAK